MRLELIQCDRCGERVSAFDGSLARAYVASHAVDHVGTSDEPADLCGRCVEALKRFMADPSACDV